MKMKRSLLVFFVVSAFGLISIMNTPTVLAGPIELAYANFFPGKHIQGALGASWAKEIEKRTNGKVKITYHPGSVLLNPPKMYDGILKGVADIGMGVFAYHRGVFPSMEAIRAVASPHTNAPAPLTISILKLKVVPKIFSPKRPNSFICSIAIDKCSTAMGYSSLA